MTPPEASLTSPVMDAVVTPCAAKGPADIASANSALIAHARRDLVPRSIANSCYVEVSKERVFYRAASDNRTTKRAVRNSLTALRSDDPNGCSGENPAAFVAALSDPCRLLFTQLLRPVSQPIGFPAQ